MVSGCHGLARGALTFLVYRAGATLPWMPRACPVEASRSFPCTFPRSLARSLIRCSGTSNTSRSPPMRIEPYTVEECNFAYCYHVYLRWGTHRRHPIPTLVRLSRPEAQELTREYG